MIQTIELKEDDYYDWEEEYFVVWFGEERTDAIKMDIHIKHDEEIYDCYLMEAEYISKYNIYKCKYKIYEE